MHYLIYEIRHIKSNKVYIGKHQTIDPNDAYFGSGKLLKRAIKKYGRDAFTKTVLFVFHTEAKMNAKEKELVTEEFCQRKDTYNICEGGKGGFSYLNKNGLGGQHLGGQAHSKEYMKNLSEKAHIALRELFNDPDKVEKFKQRVREGQRSKPNPWRGRKHKEETKRKIGLANAKQIGDKNGMFGNCWITDGLKNKIIKKTDAIPPGWKLGRKM